MGDLTVIELRGSDGGPVRVYDPDAVAMILEGPPVIVVGTETCILGLAAHTGGKTGIKLGMSALVAAEALMLDLDRSLRFTDPSGLVLHVIHPEDIMLTHPVKSDAGKFTAMLLRGFGTVLVRESLAEVDEAVRAWVKAFDTWEDVPSGEATP